jgi:hypothetical protein
MMSGPYLLELYFLYSFLHKGSVGIAVVRKKIGSDGSWHAAGINGHIGPATYSENAG